MFRFFILICSIFSVFPVDNLIDLESPIMPPSLRRQTRELSNEAIQYAIKNCALKHKLITMVRYVGSNDITEEKIIKLINDNPQESNPYSDSHQAYLIALACRGGYLDIVKAIIENNSKALNCYNSGYTPLDEAIDFSQSKVEKYLLEQGGVRNKYAHKKLIEKL